MLVRNWMTSKVVTVSPKASIVEAKRLMKENGIRRLPVVDGSRLVGIVSDRDLREFIPSGGTSFDIHEIHYLLAKTPVAEIMTAEVITIGPEATVGRAARILKDRKIGGIPVVEDDRLVGIITVKDVLASFVEALGLNEEGARLRIEVKDHAGDLAEITRLVADEGGLIISMISYLEHDKPDTRNLVLRIRPENAKGIAQTLRDKGFTVSLREEPKL
jgi:acetoin utilization protein AcuB